MFQYPPERHFPHLASPTWITQLLWLLLSVCVLIAMIKPAQAAGMVAKFNYDFAAADASCVARYASPTYKLWSANRNLAYIIITSRNYYGNYCNNSSFGGKLIGNPLTQQICPVNSFLLPVLPGGTKINSAAFASANCTCNGLFVPDAAATSCVLQCPTGQQLNAAGTACVFTPVCPAHAHRTYLPSPPCDCDTGYVWDTTRTQCLPEQYTIALSGLGGEVIPNATRAAYAQVINNSNGLPKSGAQVALSLTVVPEEDGYDHAIGHTAPHEGGLTPLSGTTGTDGRLPFVFTAPSAGGTHTITATCTNCANAATDTITVPSCPIPPLTSPPFTDPVAEGFENGNRWRPDLLTPVYQEHLACVQNGIAAAGGSYANGSAYRPTEYQQHLFEVVDKHRELTQAGYMSDYPQCQALLNSVAAEMTAHSLRPGQPVARRRSRHESGTAFDVTPIGLTQAQMIPIYTSCGVTNTAVAGEAWHVQ